MKQISAINEGKGGADKVKKNVKTINNLIKGETKISPRIKINCRDEYIVYKIPTLINIKVELRPWKSITIIKLCTERKLLPIIRKGITIICATEE